MEAIRQRLLAEQMAAIDLTKGDDEVQSVQARDRHVVKPQVKFYNPAPSVPQAFRPPLAPQSNGYQPKYDGGTNNTFGSTVDDPYRSSKPIANAYYPQPGSVKHAPVSVKSSAYNGAYASQNTGAPRYTSQPSTFSAFDPTRPHKNMSGPAIAAQAANLDLSYDEPEPFDSVYGPRIDASERDRQLQDMIANMVSLTDVDMSKAKMPGLKCVLLPHQVQGVQWMKEREKGKYKGGILADDMGLGKTVQMLALIVSNRPGVEGASIIEDPEAERSSKKTTTKGTTKGGKRVGTSKETEKKAVVLDSKTTLIIAPLAVIKQWEREVHEKTDAGLKVYIHHGSSRAKAASTFAKYDVVVTTYTTAAAEYGNTVAGQAAPSKSKKSASKAAGKQSAPPASSDEEDDENADSGDELDSNASDHSTAAASKPRGHTPQARKVPVKKAVKPKPAPLFEADWLRIVLDEAQNIKNHRAKCSLACFSLSIRATSKWCLTGTPIQNNAYEMFSLIHFLRVAPFDNYGHFKEKIGEPLKSTNQNRVNWGMKRLCVVLQSIMLRRTKDTTHEGKRILNLPERLVHVVSGDFDDPEERLFYAELEQRVRKNVKEAERDGGKVNYMGVLLMLLRLRQACSHPALISRNVSVDASAADTAPAAPSQGNEGAAPQADDDGGLADLLAGLAVGSRKCDRCQTTLPTATADKLCTECAETQRIQDTRGKRWTETGTSSTKVNMMLRLLKEIKEEGEGEKTIVFSQFTSFLDLVEPFLLREKYNYVRYDGSMRPEAREAALEQIRSDPKTTVILISFKAGSTGLNLTCCSRVILMDLWWNPQIEEQAFDRAHRLGQQRKVHIYKLSITSTVEERILEMQNKKRGLAKAALEGSKLAKKNQLDKKELLYLFNGGPVS